MGCRAAIDVVRSTARNTALTRDSLDRVQESCRRHTSLHSVAALGDFLVFNDRVSL